MLPRNTGTQLRPSSTVPVPSPGIRVQIPGGGRRRHSGGRYTGAFEAKAIRQERWRYCRKEVKSNQGPHRRSGSDGAHGGRKAGLKKDRAPKQATHHRRFFFLLSCCYRRMAELRGFLLGRPGLVVRVLLIADNDHRNSRLGG